MKEKVIGILGGMGPEATVDIFSRIVALTKAKTDEDHLRILIDNNPKMPSRQDSILNDGISPVPDMIATALNLKNAGADFIILAANTAHYYFEEIKNAVRLPMLHIIEETVIETMNLVPNIKKIGVLATSGAMKTKIYHHAFENHGIKVIEIDDEMQTMIQKSIFSFKYDGLTKANLEMLQNAARYLIDRGAEALIMGCTEIPLILQGKHFTIPLINPNEVIAYMAIQYAKNKIEKI